MSRRGVHATWIAGAACGAAAMTVALGAGATPAVRSAPPATLHVTVLPTGELAVERPGVVVRATGLAPGGRTHTGTTVLRNQTARTLRVRLRVRPDGHELDGLVHVRVAHEGRVLSAARLDPAPRWSSGGIVLAPLERATVHVYLRGVEDPVVALAGRAAAARLQLRSEVVGS